MQFFAVLLSTVALAVFTFATPLHIAERDYEPALTEPREGAIWTIGDLEWCCWYPPPPSPNITGVLYLLPAGESYAPAEVGPFSTSFPLTEGCIFIAAPNVTSGSMYTLARKSSHLASAIGRRLTGEEQCWSSTILLVLTILVASSSAHNYAGPFSIVPSD